MTPKETYDAIGQNFIAEHDAEMGQMFGKASLKFKGKAFAAFQNDCMIFRLGKETISGLKDTYSEAENWDPSGKGRPMKDWLSVPYEHSNSWKTLAEQSLEFLKANL